MVAALARAGGTALFRRAGIPARRGPLVVAVPSGRLRERGGGYTGTADREGCVGNVPHHRRRASAGDEVRSPRARLGGVRSSEAASRPAAAGRRPLRPLPASSVGRHPRALAAQSWVSL